MARAISSFPVPVSPKMSTVASVSATFSTCASTRRSAAEEPTISSNIDARSMSSRNARFSWRIRSSACLRSSMSLLVPQRVVMDEKPAILPVVPSGTLFVGKRDAACQRLLTFVVQPLHIVRMKHPSTKVCSHHLVQGETGVSEHGLIRIQIAPIRSQDDDGLGDGIDDPSQLLFVLPESLFRLL